MKISRILTGIIITVSIAIVVLSITKLAGIYTEYIKGRHEYTRTADAYVSQAEIPDTPPKKNDVTVKKEKPRDYRHCPITVDFDGLQKKNGDVVGWLYAEGTTINYPVLKGTTNDTYLRHTISGTYNTAGCIFVDFRTVTPAEDTVTLVYGHNMHDGSMFADLLKYSEQSYYNEHPYMWFLTPGCNYRLDLQCGGVVSTSDRAFKLLDQENGISDAEALGKYLDDFYTRSTFVPEKYIKDPEKTVILSTCSYEFEDARYIIAAIPVKEEDINE